MRVLYLEDHASDADLMVRTLARHMPQAEVTLASDVAGARSLLANDPHFDLALLDMRLPDGDGFEILSEIRSRSLPIATVMLTGVGDEHSAVRALKLRADDYLVKSGNYLEQLPNVFHYALERCRRDGERRLPMLRVLYAEHNRDDVELTRLHFQRQAPHIQLHIVSGAQGVLDWAVDADRTEVHVLLLDYRLIGMDALELIKTLRRDHALDLPIVLVTGRGSEEAAAAALRLGVSDYLIKQPGYLEKLPLVLEHAYAHDALLRERARLYHLATYDELTGLFNRTEFCARAEQALRHDNRLGKRCALMLVDLDDFKAINDTYGHGAGDQLLRAVAGRLHDTLREDDICGRFGGDEFLILLESVDESDQVARTATRIADALLERFSLGPCEVLATASIGIAVYPDDTDNVEGLVKFADTAMYKAKAAGRGNYRFFDTAMNAEVAERFSLESDLHGALERDELFLEYQPQVDLDTGRVVGVEALLRWRHPTRGVVGPDRFIPVAEAGTLIIRLGEWVIDEACRQARAWDALGLPPLRIAINLSARQVQHEGLGSAIASILARHALAAGRLEVELTETAVTDDPEFALRTLEQLKTLGVTIALDDFGTGYSSMSYLKRYPLDRLKIDRSFVAAAHDDPDSRAIVAATIGLAHLLGLESVAEGVENDQQLAMLRDNRCDMVQGYHLARPMPPDDFVAWLGVQAGEG